MATSAGAAPSTSGRTVGNRFGKHPPSMRIAALVIRDAGKEKPQGFGLAHDRQPGPGAGRTTKGRMTVCTGAAGAVVKSFFRPQAMSSS